MNNAQYLIEQERKQIPTEARWLANSAQDVLDRAAKGTLRISLVRDVLAQAESLKRHLETIETLEQVES